MLNSFGIYGSIQEVYARKLNFVEFSWRLAFVGSLI